METRWSSYLFNFFNSIVSFSWNSHLFRLDIDNDQDGIGHIAAIPPVKNGSEVQVNQWVIANNVNAKCDNSYMTSL